jgi:hypothetical protein
MIEQEECSSCKKGKIESGPVAGQKQGVMVMKWMNKKSLSWGSTFYSDIKVAVTKRGKDLSKPRSKNCNNMKLGREVQNVKKTV